MSKSNAIRALVGTLALCLPAVAATTISDDEIGIRLLGAAQGERNSYELTVGTVVLLVVSAHPGDLIAVQAVPLDKFGRPDLSGAFFLVEPTKADAAGNYFQFFTIPAAAAGLSFTIQAGGNDPMNRPEKSAVLTIAVSDAQILHAPPPARPRLIRRADPVSVE